MNLSEESKKKLRAVRDAILAEPELYNQNRFPHINDCGTTCCIAGWACWLDDPKEYTETVDKLGNKANWELRGANALGIPQEAAWKLFTFGCYWPDPFNNLYLSAQTAEARAEVGAARIEFFIATDGTE